MGRATFSAKVMELHKAPFWKSTPKRRKVDCWSVSVEDQKLRPS